MTVTYASIPIATRAALVPETPPPRITTLAAATPGTPPNRMPMPPCSFSRQWAPTCTDIRPATSLIGANSGKRPVGREMQIGEQDLVFAQRADLLGLRLLDLDDQLRRSEHIGCSHEDFGAS